MEGGWQGSPMQANFAQMLGQLLQARQGGYGMGMPQQMGGGMPQMGGGYNQALLPFMQAISRISGGQAGYMQQPQMQDQYPAWAMSHYGMQGTPFPFGNRPVTGQQLGNMNLTSSFVSMLNDIRSRRAMQMMPQAQSPSQPKNAGAGR